MKKSQNAGLNYYNLKLPDGLYNELKDLSKKQGTSVAEILRKFIRLGLLATKYQDDPGSSILVEENGKQKILMLF